MSDEGMFGAGFMVILLVLGAVWAFYDYSGKSVMCSADTRATYKPNKGHWVTEQYDDGFWVTVHRGLSREQAKRLCEGS